MRIFYTILVKLLLSLVSLLCCLPFLQGFHQTPEIFQETVSDVELITSECFPIFSPSPPSSFRMMLLGMISSNMSDDGDDSLVDYCGPTIRSVGAAYKSVHGYVSLVICVFGGLGNLFNLIVFTRREMMNPTNAILAALAFADLLLTVEYIPFAIYTTFLDQPKTYNWAVFVLVHSNFSQVNWAKKHLEKR